MKFANYVSQPFPRVRCHRLVTCPLVQPKILGVINKG